MFVVSPFYSISIQFSSSKVPMDGQGWRGAYAFTSGGVTQHFTSLTNTNKCWCVHVYLLETNPSLPLTNTSLYILIIWETQQMLMCFSSSLLFTNTSLDLDNLRENSLTTLLFVFPCIFQQILFYHFVFHNHIHYILAEMG